MRKLMLVVAMMALAGVASANLLVNPGFEVGPGGGGTPDDWWKYNETGQESWAAQTGTNGMAFWSWSNDTWGGFGQDVVQAFGSSDVLSFSIWGLAEVNFESSIDETWILLEFWQDGNTTWTRQDRLDVYGILTGNAGVWNQVTLITTVNLANVTMIKPIIGGGGFTNNNVGNQAVFWDNANFYVIPEPTAVVLLGLGGLLACMLRRNVRK